MKKTLLLFTALLLTITLSACTKGNMSSEDVLISYFDVIEDIVEGEDVDIEVTCRWLVIEEQEQECIEMFEDMEDYDVAEFTLGELTDTEITPDFLNNTVIENYDHFYQVEGEITYKLGTGSNVEEMTDQILFYVAVKDQVYYIVLQD